MPKYVKKGWNPNSGKNIKLAPFHQAHQLGIARKTYVKKGFNAKSLGNLDRTGKGRDVRDERVAESPTQAGMLNDRKIGKQDVRKREKKRKKKIS